MNKIGWPSERFRKKKNSFDFPDLSPKTRFSRCPTGFGGKGLAVACVILIRFFIVFICPSSPQNQKKNKITRGYTNIPAVARVILIRFPSVHLQKKASKRVESNPEKMPTVQNEKTKLRERGSQDPHTIPHVKELNNHNPDNDEF